MEKNNVIIDKLFAAGAHFGYSPSRRHPSLKSYIFGSKGTTELFDLEKTSVALESALQFVTTLAQGRKTVLFIGGKAEAKGIVKRVAERLNQPYVAGRWIGGTLTNFSEIRKRLNRLTDLTTMREKGELQKFTKLERLLIDREINDLEETFGGLKGITKLPDAMVIVDPRHESGAVDEALLTKVPTVAIMNSDCDRTKITYPIPANDASVHSISVILDEIASAYSQNLGPERAEVPAETPRA
jgi:small subunit ribosomal protein S2